MTDPVADPDPDDVALAAYAHDAGDSRFWFSTPALTYDRDTALRVIQSCLALGLTVTDKVGPVQFTALVGRLVAVDQRLSQIGG